MDSFAFTFYSYDLQYGKMAFLCLGRLPQFFLNLDKFPTSFEFSMVCNIPKFFFSFIWPCFYVIFSSQLLSTHMSDIILPSQNSSRSKMESLKRCSVKLPCLAMAQNFITLPFFVPFDFIGQFPFPVIYF